MRTRLDAAHVDHVATVAAHDRHMAELDDALAESRAIHQAIVERLDRLEARLASVETTVLAIKDLLERRGRH